jgi:hypothetical protein
VEDNQPSGARFTVEIPAIVEAESAEPEAPATSAQGAAQPALKL